LRHDLDVADIATPFSPAAMLVAAALCVAATPAPAVPPGTPPDSRATLDALLTDEQARAGDPDYDYLLGVAALEAGELQLALDALERVVLHRPTHAGAWLDLAVVHARLLDAASAEAILAHVEQTFDPPPALRAQILQARRLLAPDALQAATRGMATSPRWPVQAATPTPGWR
jgi:tetratricopeptide (TPR) repeat protein